MTIGTDQERQPSLVLVSVGIAAAWFLIVYRDQGPVGEFYHYQSIGNPFTSTYGMFYRPLTLGLIPKIQYAMFGSLAVPYFVTFAALFSVLVIILVRQITEQLGSAQLKLILCLSTFCFTNVNTITSIVTQYTTTDMVFATFYALALGCLLNFARPASRVLLPFAIVGLMLSKEFAVMAVPLIAVACGVTWLRLDKSYSGPDVADSSVRAVLVVIAGLFVVYIAILLVLPTVYHYNLFYPQRTAATHFRVSTPLEIASNAVLIGKWLLQLPTFPGYPHIYSYGMSAPGWWLIVLLTYAAVVVVGGIAACFDRKRRSFVLLHGVMLIVWIAFLSLNARPANAYIVVPIVHLCWLVVIGWLWLFDSYRNWAPVLRMPTMLILVGAGSANLAIASNALHSSDRGSSFHGSMVAIDRELRLIAERGVKQFTRVGLCIDGRMPDGTVFPSFAFHMQFAGKRPFEEFGRVVEYKSDPSISRIYVVMEGIGQHPYAELTYRLASTPSPWIRPVLIDDERSGRECP